MRPVIAACAGASAAWSAIDGRGFHSYSELESSARVRIRS